MPQVRLVPVAVLDKKRVRRVTKTVHRERPLAGSHLPLSGRQIDAYRAEMRELNRDRVKRWCDANRGRYRDSANARRSCSLQTGMPTDEVDAAFLALGL